MGQELSCVHNRKIPTLEEGFSQVCDGVDRLGENIDHAIEGLTRETPARPQCELSDKERAAATGFFWQLAREQAGGEAVAEDAAVYEDASMALCLQQLSVLPPSPQQEGGAGGSGGAAGLQGLQGEPPVRAMLRLLHHFPVGHWLKGDPTRRGYKVRGEAAPPRAERPRAPRPSPRPSPPAPLTPRTPPPQLKDWLELLQLLNSPTLALELSTVPIDNPLPASCLLQIPSLNLLVTGCANDSTLDKVEHYIDGPPTSPAYAAHAGVAPVSSHADADLGAIRPLGAVLVWRWPVYADDDDAADDASSVASTPASTPRSARGEARLPAFDSAGSDPSDSLLLSYTPLQTDVTALAYCATRRLLLVGCRTGTTHVYSLGRGRTRGTLIYRYQIDAHHSPLIAISLIAHPERERLTSRASGLAASPPPDGGAASPEAPPSSPGGFCSVPPPKQPEVASSRSPNDELMISVSEAWEVRGASGERAGAASDERHRARAPHAPRGP